jgi:iron complex outermembrane receptor protein
MTNKQRLAAGAATMALGLSGLAATPAFAQSTAGQVQEVIVTGTRTPPSTGGQAVRVNEAKDVSIINSKFIQTQLPSANIGQLINLMPGVSYTTEDPGGFNSGDLRIHGFDGAHVAFVIDGTPFNDTGNYAVYPGEYMIGELIDHITVNIGSSDVDSPSASALGATINVVTKTPSQVFGMWGKASAGTYGYARGFGEIDTGAFGPWGTTAFLAAEYGRDDNFKGRPGDNKRWDINGRIFQPLNGTDFISLIGMFTQERQYPAFRASAAQLAADPFFYGDNYTWVPETATPGVADKVPQGVGPAGADNNFWALFPNPVDFGSIRGQSQFTFAPGLTFTFDPTFFYTLANGGGSTTLNENDARLIGSSNAAGVDLNGDHDTLDTVVVYSPSNTQTYRFGVTSSLLWDLNEQNHFQVSYTLDWGHHRQTGEMTFVDPATGLPADVFGAHPGYGPPINTADGSFMRSRDRLSIAMLNQVSANYIGKFLDDRLHFNVGVRAPFFQRDLNQYCYTYNGTSAWCDTVSPAAVQSAYNTDLAANRAPGAKAIALSNLLSVTNPTAPGCIAVPASCSTGISVSTGPGGVPNLRFPFTQSFHFSRVLPNAGVSFRLFENSLLYASYAAGFSAPKTDDLYTSSQELVKPETSNNFAVGWRFQARRLNLTVSYYDSEYQNRIVQSYDPNDPTLSVDRNVGDASIRGFDIEAGWTPIDRLTLYGSANFNKSEIKSNYIVQTSLTTFALPTKGKELVLTPKETFSSRAAYDFGPVIIGFEGKYTGKRFISDTNDAWIPGYMVWNLDARLKLPQLGQQGYLMLNMLNVFDKYYISRTNTVSNAVGYPIPGTALTYSPSSLAYYVGAPRTISVTLSASF